MRWIPVLYNQTEVSIISHCIIRECRLVFCSFSDGGHKASLLHFNRDKCGPMMISKITNLTDYCMQRRRADDSESWKALVGIRISSTQVECTRTRRLHVVDKTSMWNSRSGSAKQLSLRQYCKLHLCWLLSYEDASSTVRDDWRRPRPV